jgi:hypothetical protein
MPQSLDELYDTDFTAWGERQVEALRRLARERPEVAAEVALDLGHLIEEVEALSRTEARALLTRLTLLLMHLAKWRWQPDRCSASWEANIREQRRQLPRLLRKNPVLKARLPAMLPEAWTDAREDTADETGLPPETFPETCPWTLERALDRAFLPT